MADFVSPAIQAMDLIRQIGDRVSQSGEPIGQFPGGGEFSVQLINELVEHGLVKVANDVRTFDGTTFMGVNLTLEGWEQYEQEKLGEFEGNYGFIAMKFNDDELDGFVRDVVKPAIREQLGVDLIDLRDVEQAGIIDDVMRVKIRDAKFVLADLTHDNHGAYWEAGYAEGLGKPVIYICKKEKFENASTHFDVNHCTTVSWSIDEAGGFCDRLIATLRRSLKL